MNDFLLYASVHEWPEEAAPIYGRLREQLRQKGTPIGANDMSIAAHALDMNVSLVTDHMREFERVSHLNLENWIR